MDEAAAPHRARNQAMTLTVAFNYGGRAEIVDAVKAIVASGVAPGKIDERTIHRHLYAPDIPDPDLVIRTSGEFRVSNFLLWELAYSELVFTDVLWPDFRREHLFEAVREFQARDRRYGTTGRREDGIPTRRSMTVVGPVGRIRPVTLYRDEGVVLRTHKLGEADRIVVLMTRGRRQGAGCGQGRAQDQEPLRRPAGAAQPGQPAPLRRAGSSTWSPRPRPSTTIRRSARTSTV